MIIKSLQNPIIKSVMALRKRRKRRETGETVVEGLREIERAMESGLGKWTVFLISEGSEKKREFQPVLRTAKKSSVRLLECSHDLFEKVSYGKVRDGILAVARMESPSLDAVRLTRDSLVVIVEGVEKPGNLGAILRCCDGAGVDAVWMTGSGTDLYNPQTVRASLGTVFSQTVTAASEEVIHEKLKKAGLAIVCAEPEAEDFYTDVDWTRGAALVVGREDQGLSPFWSRAASRSIQIPMRGRADSLNVAASTAVILYEALRQRTLKSNIKPG